jgi:hypothetical protein
MIYIKFLYKNIQLIRNLIILIKSTLFIDRMLVVFMGKFEGEIYGTAGNMAAL